MQDQAKPSDKKSRKRKFGRVQNSLAQLKMCQWQRQASTSAVNINTEINSRFTANGTETTEDKNEKKENKWTLSFSLSLSLPLRNSMDFYFHFVCCHLLSLQK